MEADDRTSDWVLAHLGESEEARARVRYAVARAARVFAAVAVTEENLAVTWDRMAKQQPHRAAELLARSHEAREQAARLRQSAERHRDQGPADAPGRPATWFAGRGGGPPGHYGYMARFTSYDGTQIGYRVLGTGPPLVCLPGGPGRASEYFGDLGGLTRSRQLIMLDTRGTGESEDAHDPLSYRCDRLAGDVEALRAHLGLDTMDLLGHSAAANLAMLYSAAHPQRVRRLILLTPGLSAVGIEESDAHWRAALAGRSGEPWYPDALTALDRAEAGDDTVENRRAYMPFFYGRWDDAARAHLDVGVSERSRQVRAGFGAAGAFSPASTRDAIGKLAAPVLVYAGELDGDPAPDTAHTAAGLFCDAKVTVQPGAAHFPWIDDPAYFAAAITSFLS